ncbi:hypothetical protein OUZ56_020423 [Daphnia magna]|uniref:Uncharacterized protein n=1 Tax=Daphnia magna TaxID=35525 RepID=A0ABQ9ZEF6_9CRUS|nr:hypothetical protein OUZ56_020423 [Daphnia magna]
MIIFSNRNDWTAIPSGHHIACRRLKKEGVVPTKKFESRHKEGLNQDVSFERTSWRHVPVCTHHPDPCHNPQPLQRNPLDVIHVAEQPVANTRDHLATLLYETGNNVIIQLNICFSVSIDDWILAHPPDSLMDGFKKLFYTPKGILVVSLCCLQRFSPSCLDLPFVPSFF